MPDSRSRSQPQKKEPTKRPSALKSPHRSSLKSSRQASEPPVMGRIASSFFLDADAHEETLLPNVFTPRSQEKKVLSINVLSATGLRDADKTGRNSDPYCTVEIQGGKGPLAKTKVKSNTSNPRWNEFLTLKDYVAGQTIVFKVWDEDHSKKDDHLGIAMVTSDLFLKPGGSDVLALKLDDAGKGVDATLKIKIIAQDSEDGSSRGKRFSRMSSASLQLEAQSVGELLELDTEAHGGSASAREVSEPGFLRRLFEKYAADDKGLTKEDLAKICEKSPDIIDSLLELSSDDKEGDGLDIALQQWFLNVDRDKDGRVSWSEFMDWFSNNILLDIFLQCTENGDEFLQKQKLVAILVADPRLADIFDIPHHMRGANETGKSSPLWPHFLEEIDGTMLEGPVEWDEFRNWFVQRQGTPCIEQASEASRNHGDEGGAIIDSFRERVSSLKVGEHIAGVSDQRATVRIADASENSDQEKCASTASRNSSEPTGSLPLKQEFFQKRAVATRSDTGKHRGHSKDRSKKTKQMPVKVPSRRMQVADAVREPVPCKTFVHHADTCFFAGQNTLALQFYAQGLDLLRKEHGRIDHPAAAAILHNMADAARAAGNYEIAIDSYKLALSTCFKSLGPQFPIQMQVVLNFSDLAATYESISQFDEALENYKRALAVLKRAHGEFHPDIGATYSNMAIAYEGKGQYDKAMECLGKAIMIRTQCLGELDPDVAGAHSNMAIVLEAQGRYEMALRFHAFALAKREQVHGKLHEEVACSFNNMAVAYDKQDMPERAFCFYDKAIDLRREVCGETHVTVADAMYSVGCLALSMNEFPKAKANFEGAYRIYDARYGSQHECTRATKRHCLDLCKRGVSKMRLPPRKVNKDADAHNYRAVIRALVSEMETGSAYRDLANDFYDAGKYETSAFFAKLCVITAQRKYGEYHERVAEGYDGVGKAKYASAVNHPKSLMTCVYRVGIKYFTKASTLYHITLGRDRRLLGKAVFSYHQAALGHAALAELVGHHNSKSRRDAIALHAKSIELSKLALEVAKSGLDKNDPILGTIHHHMAEAYRGMHNYADALQCLSSAFKIRDSLGEEHVDFIETCHTMAEVYRIQLKYDKALEIGSQIFEIHSKQANQSLPSVAADLIYMAKLNLEKGMYDVKFSGAKHMAGESYENALQLFRRAYTVQCQHYGSDHAGTTTSQMGIASAYELQAKYEDADNQYEIVLQIRRKSFGESHRETADVYHKIGDLRLIQRKYDESMEYYEKALAIRSKIVEKDELDLVISHREIAAVHSAQGDFDQAIRSSVEALRILTQARGGHHPLVSGLYSRIAQSYYCQTKYMIAVDFYMKSLAVNVDTHGENYPDVAEDYYRVATCKWAIGRYDDAVAYLEKAVTSGITSLGHLNPNIGKYYCALGDLRLQRGEPKYAVRAYRKSYETYKASFGAAHPQTLTVQRSLGNAYIQATQYDAAMETYEVAVKLGNKTLGETKLENALARTYIADILVKTGQVDEAMKIYLESASQLSSYLGELHLEVGDVWARAAAALTTQDNKSETALEFYAKALFIKRKALGEKNSMVATLHTSIGDVHHDMLNFECALECYSNSLEIYISLHGESHVDTAAIYMRLANSNRAMNEYGVAAKYYSHAAKIRGLLLGSESLEVAEAVFEVAENYFASNTETGFIQAYKAYQKVLDIRLIRLGNEDIDVEKVYWRMGDVSEVQSEINVAMLHYKRAVTSSIHSGDSHRQAEAFSRLAEFHSRQSQASEAVPLFREAIRLRKTQLGDNHPDIAPILCCLADCHNAAGKYAQALELHHKAAQINRTTFGEQAVEVAEVYFRIGNVHFQKQDFESALDYYDRALNIRRTCLGDRDGLVADTFLKIAEVQRARGKPDLAIPLCQKAMDIKKILYPDLHPDVGVVYADLAECHLQQKEHDTAIKLYEKGLMVTRSALGAKHTKVYHFMDRLCFAYESKSEHEEGLGNLDRALELCQEARSIAKKELGENHGGLPRTFRRLGDIYSDSGLDDDALNTFSECLTVSREQNSDVCTDVIETYNHMGVHYMIWQDYEMAKHYFDKVLNMRRKMFGWRSLENLETIQRMTIACKLYLYSGYGFSFDDIPIVLYTVASLWRSCEGYETAFEFFGKAKLQLAKCHTKHLRSQVLQRVIDINMEGVHLLTKEWLVRADFEKARNFFQAARHILQEALEQDAQLTLMAEAWCEEFERIFKEAEESGWTEWRVVPRAKLYKAQEATKINITHLTEKKIYGKRKNAIAETREEFIERVKRVVKGRVGIATLDLSIGVPAQEIGHIRRFLLEKLDYLVDGEGKIGIQKLLSGFRSALLITPIEVSNAQIAVLFKQLERDRHGRALLTDFAFLLDPILFKPPSHDHDSKVAKKHKQQAGHPKEDFSSEDEEESAHEDVKDDNNIAEEKEIQQINSKGRFIKSVKRDAAPSDLETGPAMSRVSSRPTSPKN